MILRTDPFRDLRVPFGLTGAITRPSPMPVDVYRKDDAYLVQLNLPGVQTDSIDVTIQRNVVTVSASATRVDEGSLELLLNERPFGSVSRTIALGEEIDADAVQADYTDGVLMLHPPVAETARPRRVTIHHGANQQITA